MEFLNISLTDMQIFAETYKQKSFSEAAQVLFTSRQSVARGIKNIEDVLDVELFIRTSSGIIATRAGEEFYARCAPIIQSTYDMITHMKEFRRKSLHEIGFGFLGNIKNTHMAKNIVAKFMEDHPEITVYQIDLAEKNIQEVLQKGEVDFSFLNLDIFASDPNLTSICLEEEDYLLVVHKDHPLALLPQVSAHSMKNTPIFFLSRYGIAVQIFENWMNESGVDVAQNNLVNSGDIDFIHTCLVEKHGAAFMLDSPASVLIRSSPDLVGLHLSPALRRHTGLLFRKSLEMTEAQQQLIEYFRRGFSQPSQASFIGFTC